jgi:hypothetical protein
VSPKLTSLPNYPGNKDIHFIFYGLTKYSVIESAEFTRNFEDPEPANEAEAAQENVEME